MPANEKLQELFDNVVAWAKAVQGGGGSLLSLLLPPCPFPLSLLLFRKPVPSSNAEVDLKNTVEQEAIRQDVKSKNDKLTEDLKRQQVNIDTNTQQDSAQKVHDDTLKEILND